MIVATNALCLTGRVIAPDGSPLVNAHVAVAGRTTSATTSVSGAFVIEPDPPVPFTIIVIDSQGQIYRPIEVTQTSTPLEIRLAPHVSESMTVTTGVAPDILASPGAATTFVGREDLEQRVPQQLVDAVSRVPGVDRRGDGPAAVPVIRGLAGGRTAIIIDDARITAERRAGPSATFLDPFGLASIEIARGPGSVAYGSDAFGGVIHARSRDPEPGDTSLAYELSAGFGSSDLDSAGLALSTPLGRGAASLLLHARDSDGSESGDGKPIANSQFSSAGGALRFVLPLRSAVIRAALSVDRARDTGAPAADSNVTRTYYPEEDANRFTLGVDQGIGATRIEVRAALSTYDIITNRERLPNANARRQISAADVTAKDASFRITAETPTANALFHTGVDVTSRFDLQALGSIVAFDSQDAILTRRDEVSIGEASRHDIGVFGIADLPLTPALTFSGGARVDALRVRNAGGSFGDRSRSDQAVSGHAALTWTSGAFNTTIQLGSGFREPALSDRYFRGVSGRGFVVGNPDLEPERSFQADYATRWQRGQRSIAFFAYEYRIHDLVERYASGSDFAFRNRGEAEIRGVELELATPLGRHFAMQGSISAARGESGRQALDNITPLKSHVELRWSLRRWSSFASATWFGTDNRPGPVETARPSHSVIDFGAGWKIRTSADLRLSARNILDERYAGSSDANSAQAPGRAVTLSIHGRI